MENIISPQYFNDFFIARAASGLTTLSVSERFNVSAPAVRRWENGTEAAPKDVISELQKLSLNQPVNFSTFTFIDLFAGIGGMRRAFESAGGKCVFTSEWNTKAAETYLANHGGDHPVAGDITSIPASDIPDHDVLVGGFPCQPFSLAGVSKKNSMGLPHGFSDATQGTLFFDVARIISEKKPKAFLLENVRNLKSHDKGRTFEIIMRTLTEELGYSVSWRIMEGHKWVPQKRPRIVIVGFKTGHCFDFNSIITPDTGPKLRDILHQPGESSQDGDRYAPNGIVLEKYTKSDKLWSYLRSHAAKHAAKGNGFGFGLHNPDDIARTLSARYGKDGAEILIAQEGKNPRQLTPRECARLMGFDTRGQTEMIIPVSDSQAYKQFGNSVIVPMFSAIAQAMTPHILSEKMK